MLSVFAKAMRLNASNRSNAVSQASSVWVNVSLRYRDAGATCQPHDCKCIRYRTELCRFSSSPILRPVSSMTEATSRSWSSEVGDPEFHRQFDSEIIGRYGNTKCGLKSSVTTKRSEHITGKLSPTLHRAQLFGAFADKKISRTSWIYTNETAPLYGFRLLSKLRSLTVTRSSYCRISLTYRASPQYTERHHENQGFSSRCLSYSLPVCFCPNRPSRTVRSGPAFRCGGE